MNTTEVITFVIDDTDSNTLRVITFVIEDTDSNTLRNILRTIRNEPTFEALATAIRSELALRRAFVAANIPS